MQAAQRFAFHRRQVCLEVAVWIESVDTRAKATIVRVHRVAGKGGGLHAARDEDNMAWLRRICHRTELVYTVADGRLLLEAAGFTCSEAGWRIVKQRLYLNRSVLGTPTTREVALGAALSGVIRVDLSPSWAPADSHARRVRSSSPGQGARRARVVLAFERLTDNSWAP